MNKPPGWKCHVCLWMNQTYPICFLCGHNMSLDEGKRTTGKKHNARFQGVRNNKRIEEDSFGYQTVAIRSLEDMGND